MAVLWPVRLGAGLIGLMVLGLGLSCGSDQRYGAGDGDAEEPVAPGGADDTGGLPVGEDPHEGIRMASD